MIDCFPGADGGSYQASKGMLCIYSPVLLYVVAQHLHRQDNIAQLNGMAAAASTQLLDPEVLFRANSFNSFVATWLVRFVDPRKKHPKPVVESVSYSLTVSSHAQPIHP